jgi:hypothetical protein
MVVVKKAKANKCWLGHGEKETLIDHWWECKLAQLLKKTEIEAPYDPAIPLLLLKGIEINRPKRHVHSHLYGHHKPR